MPLMYFVHSHRNNNSANGLQSLHAIQLLQSGHKNGIKIQVIATFLRLSKKIHKYKDLGCILSAEESSVKLEQYEK